MCCQPHCFFHVVCHSKQNRPQRLQSLSYFSRQRNQGNNVARYQFPANGGLECNRPVPNRRLRVFSMLAPCTTAVIRPTRRLRPRLVHGLCAGVVPKCKVTALVGFLVIDFSTRRMAVATDALGSNVYRYNFGNSLFCSRPPPSVKPNQCAVPRCYQQRRNVSARMSQNARRRKRSALFRSPHCAVRRQLQKLIDQIGLANVGCHRAQSAKQT